MTEQSESQSQSRKSGPAPMFPGYVRRHYLPLLHPTVIAAIETEAQRRRVSRTYVVSEILEEWYRARLLALPESQADTAG